MTQLDSKPLQPEVARIVDPPVVQPALELLRIE